jgi:two-component system, chemotaxis family, sensor kinase CheA
MIDHYRQAFLEEAGELLAELETALLELEKSPADGELIGRVFRALHTIKGSSAMFGFDAIAAFTHEIETVFELVRAGGALVTGELVGLALLARDLIKAMLTAPEADDDVMTGRARQLVDSFRAMVPDEASSSACLSPQSLSCADAPALAGPVIYRVRFRPVREMFLSGANPVHLLNELRQLGECRVTAETDAVPLLNELDPSLCHLSWDILLTTARGVDAIRDVFIFAGDDEVEIEVADGMPGGGDLAAEESGETAIPGPLTSQEAGEERSGREAISSIRVSADKLDCLVNLVGELVTVQARLSQTAAGRNDAGLIALAEEVERLTVELRDNALNIRMLPIGSTFSRFRRLVHDLAIELGKDVEMVTTGAETELDKTVIEMINDPLVHLIRNCIDHGIELPEVREAVGKPRGGTVQLSAIHSGGSVLITISDDGAGIDREGIRDRAMAKGMLAASAELSDKELLALIFAPGFSTSEEVTSISGRGIGMDVVKRGVDALRGSITVASRQGEGTTVTMRIPLTLAIIESLLVRIGADCYVLPLALVEECLELTRIDVARAHGRHLINVRGHIVPYIRLRDRFGVCGAPPEIEQIVITEVEGKRIGFVVDHVIGSHQTVIKSLGKVFRDVAGVSGATILGDGTVALILDIPRLVQGEELAECAA